MNPAPAYTIRSLIHAYNGNVVLDIPHLDLAAGRIYAITGPNGSGKTTLLSILALLIAPSSGSVSLQGRDAGAGSERKHLRRLVTLIHQKPVLFSTTVWNNVAYGLRARGVPGKDIKARVAPVLEKLGLSDLAGRPARELSGGEAQRVVLARGLVLETPVVLLDEPTSFLDDSIGILFFDMLRSANQNRSTTILVTTHDLKFATTLAHQEIRLESGKVASTGGTI
jgi:tungstate transport system ATP-binding protein